MLDNYGKHIYTLSYLVTIAFPMQKWLHERALEFPCTTSSVLLKLHIGLFNDAVSVTQMGWACGAYG